MKQLQKINKYLHKYQKLYKQTEPLKTFPKHSNRFSRQIRKAGEDLKQTLLGNSITCKLEYKIMQETFQKSKKTINELNDIDILQKIGQYQQSLNCSTLKNYIDQIKGFEVQNEQFLKSQTAQINEMQCQVERIWNKELKAQQNEIYQQSRQNLDKAQAMFQCFRQQKLSHLFKMTHQAIHSKNIKTDLLTRISKLQDEILTDYLSKSQFNQMYIRSLEKNLEYVMPWEVLISKLLAKDTMFALSAQERKLLIQQSKNGITMFRSFVQKAGISPQHKINLQNRIDRISKIQKQSGISQKAHNQQQALCNLEELTAQLINEFNIGWADSAQILRNSLSAFPQHAQLAITRMFTQIRSLQDFSLHNFCLSNAAIETAQQHQQLVKNLRYQAILELQAYIMQQIASPTVIRIRPCDLSSKQKKKVYFQLKQMLKLPELNFRLYFKSIGNYQVIKHISNFESLALKPGAQKLQIDNVLMLNALQAIERIVAVFEEKFSQLKDQTQQQNRNIKLCKKYSVSLLQQGQGYSKHQIKLHLKPSPFMRMKEFHGCDSLNCIDGRQTDEIIGGYGGYVNQFILTLNAYEQIKEIKLNANQIEKLMMDFIESKSCSAFYIHTDMIALKRLFEYILEEKNLDQNINVDVSSDLIQHFQNPSPKLRQIMLDALQTPEFIGCGHLRFTWLNVEANRQSPVILRETILLAHKLYWNKHPKLQMGIIHGTRVEKAVIIAKSDQDDYQPLIVPYRGGSSNNKTGTFVYHENATKLVRKTMAQYFEDQDALGQNNICNINDKLTEKKITQKDIYQRINDLGDISENTTIKQLAKGLPIYEVNFIAK